MEPGTLALWGIALSIAAHGVAWFFRTPKETAGEAARRIDDLEDAHHRLDKAVTGLMVEVRHLAQNVEQLTATIKHFDRARISGRQPRSP